MKIKTSHFQIALLITLPIVLVSLIGLRFNFFSRTTSSSPIQKQTAISQTIIAQEDTQQGVLGACDSGGSISCGAGCSVSTEKTPDGIYESTGFGCYVDANGQRNNSDTPGCIAYCGNVPGECDGLSEVDCMYKVKWFAANSDQFGCFNRIKVTNPANNKAVVLVVYDRGPNCSVQPRSLILDMSYPATSYLGVGNYEKVRVEGVSKDTPLGPTDGSGQTTTGPNTTTGGGSFVLSLVLQPKEDDSYVMNTATAQAIGGGGSTDPGNGSTDPVNPDATCPGVGPTTCGTLAQGCHCSAEYNTSVCGAGNTCSWCIAGQDSSKYAIDITNPLDGPVYVPKVSIGGQAHAVTCKGYADISGSTEPNQSIKVLSCVDDSTGESIWMQFHHSKLSDPAVAGKSFKTGDVTAHSAAFEVLNSGPHVHFQIGVGGPCGSDMAGCRNANEFVQCN